MLSKLDYTLALSEFRTKRADFYDDIADRVEEGASFYDEIKDRQDYARKKRKNGNVRLYGVMLRRLEEGRSITEALKGLVPNSDLMALEAAEASGALAKGLRFAAKSVRGAEELKGSVRKAVAYPAVIFLMLAGILTMFSFFLLPTFEKVVATQYWPSWGRQVNGLATFIRHYGIFLLISMVGMLWLFGYSLPNWGRSPVRKKLDAIGFSPYALYRNFQSSIFLMSLAALMESGVSLSESLQKLQAKTTPWMRVQIGRITRKLDENPSAPAAAFDTGLLDDGVMQRIHSFSKRANFQAAIAKLAITDMDKSIKLMDAKAKAMNMALILVAGITIAYVMGGVMFTAMEMDRAIKAQMAAK